MEKLIILTFLIASCHCNFWDNMFSHLESPNLDIPKEFKLHLTNTASNSTIADFFFSVSQNKMKAVLYDKIVAKQLVPIKNIEIPKVSTLYLDFGAGKFSLDFNSTCYWKNISVIKALTTEFFIKSYDLVTFFEDKPDSYQYVITNPFKTRNTTSEPVKDTSIFNNDFKGLFDEVDKRGIITFIVNKASMLLEKISFQYKSVKYLDVSVGVEVYKSSNATDFIFNDKNCTEIKDTSMPNITSVESVKNMSSKFLSGN